MNSIHLFPDDLLLNIKSYIPGNVSLILSKQYYLQHQAIINTIILKRPDNFIRYILRSDYDFVFLFRIKEYGKQWWEKNKIRYKNMIFQNKLLFYKYYAIDNNSQKCKLLIDEYINENLNIKRHKKYKIDKTIWSN